MPRTWQVPSERTAAIACVGEDDHVDALLRAALANRRSTPPIQELCEVRVAPDPDEVRIYSRHGEQLASLASADAQALRPHLEQVIAEQGELWCTARISGTESASSQWRMQIWIYIQESAATV